MKLSTLVTKSLKKFFFPINILPILEQKILHIMLSLVFSTKKLMEKISTHFLRNLSASNTVSLDKSSQPTSPEIPFAQSNPLGPSLVTLPPTSPNSQRPLNPTPQTKVSYSPLGRDSTQSQILPNQFNTSFSPYFCTPNYTPLGLIYCWLGLIFPTSQFMSLPLLSPLLLGLRMADFFGI